MIADFMRKMYDRVHKAETACDDWFAGRQEMGKAIKDRGGLRQDGERRWATSVQAKALVADNQWQMAQAQMYAMVALVEQQDELIRLMREMSFALQRVSTRDTEKIEKI